MKKAVVDQFEPGSPVWIVAHGLYQQSRGRKPSVSVMGWCHKTRSLRRLDPSKTFAKALKDVTQGGTGKYLGGHVIEMVAAATLLRRPIECNWGYGQVIRVNPGDTAEAILKAFKAQIHAERKAYWDSEEGMAERIRWEVERLAGEEARAEPIRTFMVKDELAWRRALNATQSDWERREATRYGARWANLIETEMAKGARLEDVASEMSNLARIEGVSFFWHPWTVALLAKVWVHGEQLRRWHNVSRQKGDEGERANASTGVLGHDVKIGS